jgi:FtsP/CotA-like multicopper oxidase with cupredoxin domain
MIYVGRRALLRGALAVGGAVALGACTSTPQRPAFVAPDSERVRAAEERRRRGPVRDFRLSAVAGSVDLGGLIVSTWSYDGRIPGAPLRVRAGEVVRASLVNDLPATTSVHWHGVALRNDADGVPEVTQAPVGAKSEYVYEFTAPDPGTYWFHPHSATQLDRGLYAPLIVDDPDEPLRYDDEWIVVLDDWLDGVTGSPDDVLAELRRGMGAGHGGERGRHALMGATSSLLGGDAGDVHYPHYLLNGRLPSAPAGYQGRPGARLRLRLINAGSDTAFRVALGGHRLTVTHSDGFPVEPVEVDAVLVGMGERYDVVVTLQAGVFPLVALAEGKDGTALGVVRTAAGSEPPADAQPPELDRRILSYRMLRAAQSARLPDKSPDRTVPLEMTGGMERYDWGFNGRPFDHTHMEPIRESERVRLELVNRTTMWHPIHLHGHTFAIAEGGTRKDTVVVLPNQRLEALFDANNPGRWMVHCHNLYHAEAGMMTTLAYEA